MNQFTIDVEGKSDYKKLLNQLKRRNNTEILNHGEYIFGGLTTGFFQIIILTDKIGKLVNSRFVYGIVDENGNLL